MLSLCLCCTSHYIPETLKWLQVKVPMFCLSMPCNYLEACPGCSPAFAPEIVQEQASVPPMALNAGEAAIENRSFRRLSFAFYARVFIKAICSIQDMSTMRRLHNTVFKKKTLQNHFDFKPLLPEVVLVEIPPTPLTSTLQMNCHHHKPLQTPSNAGDLFTNQIRRIHKSDTLVQKLQIYRERSRPYKLPLVG